MAPRLTKPFATLTVRINQPSNEKVIARLRKLGPVDLNDPITRIALIGELGSIRRVKRENVITAIDIASRKKDSIIDSDKERRELAVLITRQANRDRERVED